MLNNNTNSTNTEYYDLLELSKDCNNKDIKKSYHKLAMKYHPDKNPNNKQYAEKFKKITEAYSILSDSKKRDNYDKFGKMDVGMDFDPSSIFKMFSNFNLGEDIININNNKNKINHKYVNLSLSLEDINSGCNKTIEYNCELFCSYCLGTGSKYKNINYCNNCNGTGKIQSKQGIGMIQFQSIGMCNICNGTGEIISPEDRCLNCKGNKLVKCKKKISINIPVGIKYNEIIEIKNKGNQYDDNNYSNLIIKIVEKEHKYYKRINNTNDIYMELSILLSESLLGFNKIITDLNNKKTQIQSPNNLIIKPNMILIGNGLGIDNGNLYIQINVIFPNKLEDIQRKYLSKILPVYKENNEKYNSYHMLIHKKNIDIVQSNNTNHDSPPNCTPQ